MNEMEYAEFTDLCDALADRLMTEPQRARFNEMLADSEEARRFYVRFAGLGSSLATYAAELQSEPRYLTQQKARVIRFPVVWRWTAGALAAAAAVVFALTLSSRREDLAEPDSVAWLTGAQDAEWNDATLATGDALDRGQHLDLRRGVAELTFDSGARVTVEAPASLEVQSGWAAELRSGAITASASPDAPGFRVNNRAVNVTSLGGEVRVVAGSDGVAEVCALTGSAEADQPGRGQRLLLRDRQARRFAHDGVTRINAPMTVRGIGRFDRRGRPVRFARWSFDEVAGAGFTPQTLGVKPGALTASFQQTPSGPAKQWLQPGRWKRALALDGRESLAARLPAGSPRTVAFWVKVPADAPLGEGVAMMGWGRPARGPIAGAQILWNRDAERGPLGALRTEQDTTAIVGRTSLRDGAWHHVAVLFLGGRGPRPFVQVKQYVDGRFDAAGIIPRATRGAGAAAPGALVSIGRAARDDTAGLDGFAGELDELLIADRPLTPDEIRRLMEENEPPGGA